MVSRQIELLLLLGIYSQKTGLVLRRGGNTTSTFPCRRMVPCGHLTSASLAETRWAFQGLAHFGLEHKLSSETYSSHNWLYLQARGKAAWFLGPLFFGLRSSSLFSEPGWAWYLQPSDPAVSVSWRLSCDVRQSQLFSGSHVLSLFEKCFCFRRYLHPSIYDSRKTIHRRFLLFSNCIMFYSSAMWGFFSVKGGAVQGSSHKFWRN